MVQKTGQTIDNQYKTYLDNTYNIIPKDQTEKIIDSIMSLEEMGRNKKQPLDAVLDHACRMIFRLFNFHEVCMGLKDRDENIYRYQVFFGQRKDILDRMKKIRYTEEDMLSQDKYPFVMIGKLAQLNPFEGLPEWEKDLFGRTYQLGEKRSSNEEFHEGDYIDFWIYGANDELVGWIEATRIGDNKLPSRTTIRWVELIADVLGGIIVRKRMEEGSPHMR
jgi:hypothetical protein